MYPECSSFGYMLSLPTSVLLYRLMMMIGEGGEYNGWMEEFSSIKTIVIITGYKAQRVIVFTN